MRRRAAEPCAYRGCEAPRVAHERQSAGDHTSTDGPLGFCRAHWEEMYELASVYKGLQDVQGYRPLADKAVEVRDLMVWWAPDAMREVAHVLRICAGQRRAFQERLKDTVPKAGHVLFIRRLEQAALELEQAAAAKERAPGPPARRRGQNKHQSRS